MLVHEAKVGMQVMFGRENGEKTLGEIVKINPTKAKVKILQNRGSSSAAGAIWSVPYSMMTHAGVAMLDEFLAMPPRDMGVHNALMHAIVDPPVPYNEFAETNLIMEAIVDTYNRLSPEWLTCDGELPQYKVVARKRELERRLKGLFMAMGRDVSETAAYQWDDERRKKAV
jgi:hypothetical protein